MAAKTQPSLVGLKAWDGRRWGIEMPMIDSIPDAVHLMLPCHKKVQPCLGLHFFIIQLGETYAVAMGWGCISAAFLSCS